MLDDRAGRQVRERCAERLLAAPRRHALEVERGVDLRVRMAGQMVRGEPRRLERIVSLAALPAGTVPGGEGGRFVEEEQF